MIPLNGKKKFAKTVHFPIENNPIDAYRQQYHHLRCQYAAKPEYSELRQFIAQRSPSVPVISYVEVLGYYSLPPDDKAHFEKFFQTSRLLPISQEILDQAVRLKQQGATQKS